VGSGRSGRSGRRVEGVEVGLGGLDGARARSKYVLRTALQSAARATRRGQRGADFGRRAALWCVVSDVRVRVRVRGAWCVVLYPVALGAAAALAALCFLGGACLLHRRPGLCGDALAARCTGALPRHSGTRPRGLERGMRPRRWCE
jgi:hypothetical protein